MLWTIFVMLLIQEVQNEIHLRRDYGAKPCVLFRIR
jgi:hypothetical protein